MNNIIEPAKDTRLIRSLDSHFLENLKQKIASDPSGPGVPPVAVLCVDVQEKTQFSERLKDVYKYEVLGGQHTSTARAELHAENPDNSLLARVLAEVYIGLTDDEALRLASRHNANGHFIHPMTHRDYVSLVYLFLFSLHATFFVSCILYPTMSDIAIDLFS